MSRVLVFVALTLSCGAVGQQARSLEKKTENVILITIDGLRVEELFGGADERLLNRSDGGVRNVATTRQRFWSELPDERRRRLMPFFWKVVARQGQVWGDAARGSEVRVTNGRYFSYPGYNEILCGYADPKITSNDKRDNRNVTVLEWLNSKPRYRNRVAAFCSWDVFPYILNARRSSLYVNAGWQELDVLANLERGKAWNEMASTLPRYWDNVRYDAFTCHGAIQYLRAKRPRVLYVALGETDDWAHDGRYDLYLDAARRSDDYIRRLWETAQSMDQYRGKLSLVITTDHGRGTTRDGWKNHGATLPGSEFVWVAMMGPDTGQQQGQPERGQQERGLQKGKATQSQVAATVAALLGEDFAGSDPRIAKALR